MNGWELPEEDAQGLAYKQATIREIAAYTVNKYREHLKCGDDPCVGCDYVAHCHVAEATPSRMFACGPKARYEGQQAGLAQCEALIHKREQEIVGFIHDWAYLTEEEFMAKYQREKTFLPTLLSEWLKGA